MQPSCEIPTCGIGEVATHENFRRRGIATKLLERSTSYMKENNFALSVLHTSTASKLYESLGWTPAPREFLTRRIPFDLFSSQESIAQVEIFPSDDSKLFEGTTLEQLMTIYSRTSKRYNGPIVRDHVDYWKCWVNNETGKILWHEEYRTPRRYSIHLGGSLVGLVVLQFGNEV